MKKFKTVAYELMEKQAYWLVQNTQINLDKINAEIQMSKVRGRKFSFNEVAFVKRKFILLGGGYRYFKWLHGLRARRNTPVVKMEVSSDRQRSARKLPVNNRSKHR